MAKIILNQQSSASVLITTGYKVEISSSQIEILEGVSKSGTEYKMIKQEAFLHGGKYPIRMLVSIEDETKPLENGYYHLENLLVISGYGELMINRDVSLKRIVNK
jgi:hypothetical protein